MILEFWFLFIVFFGIVDFGLFLLFFMFVYVEKEEYVLIFFIIIGFESREFFCFKDICIFIFLLNLCFF